MQSRVTVFDVIAFLIFFRGFLKGDKALGQVQLKLTPFDNKCEIHDCYDVSSVSISSFIDVLFLEAKTKYYNTQWGLDWTGDFGRDDADVTFFEVFVLFLIGQC